MKVKKNLTIFFKVVFHSLLLTHRNLNQNDEFLGKANKYTFLLEGENKVYNISPCLCY